MRYGIPDFKLEKNIIDRRVAILEEEGILFRTNAYVGVNVSIETIKADFDAVLLSGGATERRGIPIKGNHLRRSSSSYGFLEIE